MSESKFVKLVVFVPSSHADTVRQALGDAGSGTQGNYSFCSFSVKGVGRFRPEDGAHPAVGTIGELEAVEEERIETICPRDRLRKVIAAVKKVHPYEEVALNVYSLEN